MIMPRIISAVVLINSLIVFVNGAGLASPLRKRRSSASAKVIASTSSRGSVVKSGKGRINQTGQSIRIDGRFKVVGGGGTTVGGGSPFDGPGTITSGGGGGGNMCLPEVEDDCGEEQKCTTDNIFADRSVRCRDIDDNADQVGDLCSEAGLGDSCDSDGICLEGTCREVVYGPEFDCEDIRSVARRYPAGLAICEPLCDPILRDCPDGFCTRIDAAQLDGAFSCHVGITSALGIFGDECTISTECREGSICRPANTSPYCSGGSLNCCTPLCELESTFCEDDQPGSPGVSCRSIWNGVTDPDEVVGAFPGLENIGVCATFF